MKRIQQSFYDIINNSDTVHDSIPVGQEMQENEATAGSEPAGHFTSK